VRTSTCANQARRLITMDFSTIPTRPHNGIYLINLFVKRQGEKLLKIPAR
jgi:hypothetical protein